MGSSLCQVNHRLSHNSSAMLVLLLSSKCENWDLGVLHTFQESQIKSEVKPRGIVLMESYKQKNLFCIRNKSFGKES